MPSFRRVRTILFTAVIGALVLLYVTTSSSSTRSSPFYAKTAALINSRSRSGADRVAAAAAAAVHENPAPAVARTVESAVSSIADSLFKIKADKAAAVPKLSTTAIDQDPTLRQRLRDAESAAKKSADSRFRNLQEAQKVIDVTSDATAEKSVAGRKIMPTKAAAKADDAQDEAAAEAEAARKAEDAARKVAEAARQAVVVEYNKIMSRSPVVIFSKSYCPYSAKGKHVMTEAYTIKPAPFVVELDQHPKGQELQAMMREKTGRRTVPNILIGGTSLGGGDDAESLWRSGGLAAKVKEMGKEKIVSVIKNLEYPSEES